MNLKRRIERLEANQRHMETAIDALLVDREYRAGEDVGFNGQRFRKKMFADLVAALRPDAIVETGTWTGNTTGYMAETTGLPVYSCEVVPRFHAISAMRLANVPGVYLSLADSRTFLGELSSGPLADKSILFYLDAHWYADLPLPEEVDWIASHWDRFAMMVDDFQVPDDPGYGFGQYENGTMLTLDLLARPILRHGLSARFPATPSNTETGRRRGCVVLTPHQVDLSQVRSLRNPPG